MVTILPGETLKLLESPFGSKKKKKGDVSNSVSSKGKDQVWFSLPSCVALTWQFHAQKTAVSLRPF